MSKKIVLIGWHPSAVDYDKHPGLTPEKLQASFSKDEAAFRELGFQSRLALIRDAGTAASEVATLLRNETFDVVLIGAGVRRNDDCFKVFEQLVNVVHEHAPRSRIAFNTGPTDSVEAIQRWA